MRPSIVISFVFPGGTGDQELSRFISNAMKVNGYRENLILKPSQGRRYVYGLKGISELFGVSKATAQKYKDGILKDACYQSGRKIVVDVEKAMDLFHNAGK